MSKRKVKYKYSNRAKGAAIARMQSPANTAARKKSKRIFALALAIIVVALIDSILLISISSFSWIEDTSSLKIRGDKMPITDNRKYEVTVDGTNQLLDLHDYFDDVSYFRFAKASSVDGLNFYFPMFSTSAIGASSGSGHNKVLAGAYREGDVTDYNTAYYCIDFRFKEEAGRSANYFLGTNNLFSVTGAADSAENADDADDINAAAAKCYRLSIQSGSESPLVFSNNPTADSNYPSGTVYYAANAATVANNAGNEAVSLTSGASHMIYNPLDYKYQATSASPVCSLSSDETTDVTVRIWFEVNDPAYIALDSAQKRALDNTRVSVNLTLMNEASDVISYYFEDYSGATRGSATINEATGQPVSTDRMYFAYRYVENSVEKYQYIPMAVTESDGGRVKWRTASPRFKPTDAISKTIQDALAEGGDAVSKSYFFYGSVSNGTPAVVKKWKLNDIPVDSNGQYIYVAYGVTDDDDYDANGCFGGWLGSAAYASPKLIRFNDLMINDTDSAYNASASVESPIESAVTKNTMYLSTVARTSTTASQQNVAEHTIHMIYDEADGCYKAYLPSASAGDSSTNYFRYQPGGFSPSSVNIEFISSGTPDDSQPVYTALGYCGTGDYSTQSSILGIGTWTAPEKVYLSNELTDSLIDSDHRYRITLDNTNYYYMAGEAGTMLSYAYVPNGTTAAGFQLTDYNDESTLVAKWNGSARNGSDTFYPINLGTESSTAAIGFWNIAVLVDATRDNLIDTILDEAADTPSLKFSVDNFASSYDMVQIDDTRWCAGLTSSSGTVKYRFTAYSGLVSGYVQAQFDFTHDLSDGIYYVVTEPMLAPPAAVVEESDPGE